MRRMALILLGLWLSTQTGAIAATPQQFIDSLISDYRTMKPGKEEELGAEDKKHNEGIRKLLLDKLDVEKLGQLALQDHWDTLRPEQRSEFLSVLRTVLEERSLKNIKGTRENFEVQYDGVDALPNGDSLVKTILQTKKDEYYIDFKLAPRADSWIIYDVITDDVSTIRNYRDQFNKIIAEKGFDELLRRMKSNLIDDPSVAKKTEAG